MTLTFLFRLFIIAAGAFAALGAPRLHAQTLAGERGTLLDVPYLAQTELLCGGAALAMVMRYWGATNVTPQDFEHLIDNGAGGISTGKLAAAVTDRGWTANPSLAPATDPLGFVAGHVNAGRPVLALVEDRPGVGHYLVIVGVTADVVVLHDPARAPFRVMPRSDFLERWKMSDRWLAVVLPPAHASSPAPGSPPESPAPSDAALAVPAASTTGSGEFSSIAERGSCATLVSHSVEGALAGRLADAESGLLAATSLCPDSADAWRELAGLRLVQRRYVESQDFAERAVRLDGNDRHAAELLATTRFANGDLHGALDAWNRIGLPALDIVTIEGLRRTHHPVVLRVLGLEPRAVFTTDALLRSSRRLEDLPSAARSSVRYTSSGANSVAVTAYVDERRAFPRGLFGWVSTALRAGISRELRFDMAALAHQGELWTAAYRWPSERPRLGFALALPAPGPLRGVVTVEALGERQTYMDGASTDVTEQDRRRTAVGLSDWATGRLSWRATVARDRFDHQTFAAVSTGVTARLLADHVVLLADVERWMTTSNAVSGFSALRTVARWRSTTNVDSPHWSTEAGLTRVSAEAPRALWPGAGSQGERGILLRAHPLLDHNIVNSSAIGRTVRHAGVSYERPILRSPYGTLSAAGFVDYVRIERGSGVMSGRPADADIGGGIRVNGPAADGKIRLDVAVGVRDGHVRLSAGYVARWGSRSVW